MTISRRLAVLAATTAVAVTLLSGCAITSGSLNPVKTSSTKPSVTATPTAAALTAATITVGQELTTEQALTLRKSYNDLIDAGKVLYSMPDGSAVVVGLKEAVPAVVVADASAKANAAAAASAAAKDLNSGLVDAIASASQAVGHKLVLVAWALDANAASTARIMQWDVFIPAANVPPQRVARS